MNKLMYMETRRPLGSVTILQYGIWASKRILVRSPKPHEEIEIKTSLRSDLNASKEDGSLASKPLVVIDLFPMEDTCQVLLGSLLSKEEQGLLIAILK